MGKAPPLETSSPLCPRECHRPYRRREQQQLTHATVARYSIFVGLAVIVVLCAASWFLAPKGQNQVFVVPVPTPSPPTGVPLTTATCRLWRSSLILSIVSCFLMWAITFLAQLNPLIVPKRSDLREEFLGH